MSRANAEIPHYDLGHTIELGAMTTWLAQENARRPIEARLLPIALLLKAIALGLEKTPELNGHYRDGKFFPAPAVDLGVAISLRGGGLVAPALPDAASADVSELMTRLNDLVSRARKGALRSSEMSNPSVTVTNLGERGVESVFGVIYPPQVALVGLGTILERPWVVDGELSVRPTVQVSLAADHRVSDGHRGGLFLQTVDKLLQSPESL
jgi:pyruvate dehydrogenase E2 component (dihydrolipoamide acetyltransferase)